MARRSDSESSAFDRDFGYLMPFLDKVAAAASQLQDPAARAELQRLMAEEKPRWERARELLSGAQGRAAPGAAQGRAAPAAAPVRAMPAVAGAPYAVGPGLASTAPGAPQLTVGSLKRPR